MEALPVKNQVTREKIIKGLEIPPNALANLGFPTALKMIYH
jgi:hypothetical protein